MRIATVIYWLARILAAVIMLQTLYFKFMAAPESVFIFATVGLEPWGRIVVGLLELVASGLLIITATAWLGAGLALGLMTGAVGIHLTVLGIEVQGDGGYLFFLALIVSLCAAYVLWYDQAKVQEAVKRFTRKT